MTYRTTARDLELLYELWARGKLSRLEITERFFDNNRSYAYRRLQMLKERDWIRSHMGRVEYNGQVIPGSAYELLEEGKQQLLRAGKITIDAVAQIRGDAPQSKRRRKRARKWTMKDISLLHEVYKLREMSKAQCLTLFFRQNEVYGRKRIEIMRQAGVLHSVTKYAKELGRLQATVRITERGLQLLAERGLVQEGAARARDLELSDKQRSYILDANEISFKVSHIPYLDSRAIKRKYNLNRGDLVLGALSPPEGDYMLYILTSNVFETTIKRILEEIGTHKNKRRTDDVMGIAGYLIYYRDTQARDSFERHSVGLVTGGVPVHLLPFSERGIYVIRELIFGEKETLLRWMRIGAGHDGTIRNLSSRYHFEYGVTYPDGTSKYVIDGLTGNKVLLERIMREYSGVTAKGRMNALLFCWDEDEAYFREKTKQAHYIEIVPIPWSGQLAD